MTTTELIKILQDNEIGGISHKPRNISLCINRRYMPEPKISLSSTGDGICGPEIDLDIEGDWLEQQPKDAKETIIKSALKYLVKMQIEEGSVGFAVDNDPDHDCCWDDVLVWLEAQPCEDCISRAEGIEGY